jgi:5-(carboxyamino)imidazole ribonucleotide synthase
LKDLSRFLKACSSATYESEFYDATAIERASNETGVPVWPNPSLMAALQDRLSQKNLFDQYDLPTAPWRPVDAGQDAVVAYVALDRKVVFKKRRGGYDGYGTFIVKDDRALGEFAQNQLQKGSSFIAEKWVRFQREIAVIAVRDQAGAVFFYPFVESYQKDARCLWVKGPLKETRAIRDIKTSIARFLSGIGYVGAMGIEMFETADGIVINEIAPRVHNTGHYTQDAFDLSQFALHMRAVSGLRTRGLAVPKAKGFAMWNLLGTAKPTRALAPWLADGRNNTDDGSATLHWYGKHETRPGRKMGHVNAIAKNAETALAQARKLAARFAREIGF